MLELKWPVLQRVNQRSLLDAIILATWSMPINSATWLEDTASFPHVTMALAELCGAAILMDDRLRNETNKCGVNTDVIALSHRFALLMSEYHLSIQDGISTVNERK